MAKKDPVSTDPHAAREAQRYDTPTASREFILSFLEQSGKPMTLEELALGLDMTEPETHEGLRRRLIAMTRDAQLICNRRQQYGLPKKMNLIRGRVQGHKDGYGFVIPELGDDDLYLTSRQMRRVFDGDIVMVRDDGKNYRDKREAVIVEVVERRTSDVVGRLHYEDGVAFVIPDNSRITHDIMVPGHALGGAAHGQYVTVKIVRQPEFRARPMGHITEVLGDHMAPGMEIDVALRTHAIPFRWPDAVEQETAGLHEELLPEDKLNRIDLRDLPLITIDGEDARDFDDAVFCSKKPGGGWRLYVAIADVSHYVLPGSALDQEAIQRGNSVYFPDHVVPMLPEVLSNGLCSLKPHVDRACMVCEMTISDKGRLSGYTFYEGLMHSKARLTYTEVGQMLAATAESALGQGDFKYPDLVPHILELEKLYVALRQAREARGAIDFETVETRILFDRERKIERIVPVLRNDAHKLIEECMLCANVATAKFFSKYKIPALYRVHKGPSEQRLEKLKAYIAELGLFLPGATKPTTKDYQQLFQMIKERPDAATLQTVMLRSLSQAVYTPENEGHFGLGYKAYAHFTSPIRRYPDLLAHRAIRHLIRSERACKQVRRLEGTAALANADGYLQADQQLAMLGEHCSMTERRADEATRDVMSWLKCEYLTQHVGEQFNGVVTAVTSFGLFVELNDLYVEGLVHVSSLRSDYYQFDGVRHRLIGERSGTVFRLGDAVKIRVVRVGLDDRKIDLELLGQAHAQSSKRRGNSRRADIMAEWNADFARRKSGTGKARRSSQKKNKGGGPAGKVTTKPNNTAAAKSIKTGVEKPSKPGKSNKSGKATKSAHVGKSGKSAKAGKAGLSSRRKSKNTNKPKNAG